MRPAVWGCPRKDPRRVVGGAGGLSVLGVESRGVDASGERGPVRAAVTTALKDWSERIEREGEGGLFVCSWNARRGTVECRELGRGDRKLVLRRYRDFVSSVGTVGDGEKLVQKRRDRERTIERKTGRKKKGR